MKKLFIIIAIALIPTFVSVSSVSAAQETMPERIPFTNKPVTPGVPESYIGTYGQCPFYENAMEKGCYPPSDIKCNADWSSCEYIGTTWTPETTVTTPTPQSATNTQVAPQSPSNEPKQGNSKQNIASNSTTQTNNDDQSTEMQAKPQVDPENGAVLASVDANKTTCQNVGRAVNCTTKNDDDKQIAAVEQMSKSLIEFYIAAFGIVMWIVLMIYIHAKHPTFFHDAIEWYKEKFEKLTKRR